MKVMITGGTGFVGFHICRQLTAAGHRVRLLVRNPEKARELYEGSGEDGPELIAGDITDPASIQLALAGCDAVVHAAAVTPLQVKSVEQLFAANVGGVKHVVGAALDLGIDRIVCVSSITAIFNTDGSKVTPDAPLKPSKQPYGQSKLEAELYLRDLQERGVPIAIIYPGGVMGPDDPGFSDTNKSIKYRITGGFRIFGDGGTQYIDVRDLAALACSLVVDGGSGRFLLPGVFSNWLELADIIEDVSGCQLDRMPAQGWKLRLLGRLFDLVRLVRKVDSPISAETMRYATQWPRIRNTDELEKRGLSLRSARESLDDTLRWMVEAGHLEATQCPNYGSDP